MREIKDGFYHIVFLIFIPFIFCKCHFVPYYFPSDSEELEENDTQVDVEIELEDIKDSTQEEYFCVPVGVDDNCNEIDDDCNGIIDDNFDKMRDPENCGFCGRRCVGVNEIYECREGNCVFVGCQPGFEDLDPDVEGCEYRCPVYPPTAEDCNGVDEDCDGKIDEPEDLAPPPPSLCRDTPGTPCEGTRAICDTRGNPPLTTWYCDYSPEVEFRSSVPNGIVIEETLCDGYDGDCDGIADDPFTDLGLECDNGMLGACRDAGRIVCDSSDPTRTVCDLSFPPDALTTEPMQEECNNIDDNCDGIVDNTEGEGRVIDDMVEINRGGLHFWIYRYEASRPDATSSSQGFSSARTCSKPDALPWTLITFESARQACEVTGKRLCSADEFLAACGGPSGYAYPYGNTYDPLACNGLDFDGISGGDDDDVLLPTGSSRLSGCVSSDGVYDLSGNAREWTSEISGDSGPPDYTPVAVTRGGSYITPQEGLTCNFNLSRAITTTRLPSLGFRCCSDSPP